MFLTRTLRATFVNSTEITMVSEFSCGVNSSLNYGNISQSDVPVDIASGRLKP
jgi:hypothetical protein